MELSEKETRESIIDPYLHDAGWKEEYIKREVNSIKSDFKVKKYETHKDSNEKPEVLKKKIFELEKEIIDDLKEIDV